MNESIQPPQVDAEVLDRLVDGELKSSEYRRVLTALDASPDGWKQCALHFLEAQALRQEFQEFFTEPSSDGANADVKVHAAAPSRNSLVRRGQLASASPTRRSMSKSWQSFGSVAALIVAFMLGWWIPGNTESIFPDNSPLNNHPNQPTQNTQHQSPYGNLELAVGSPLKAEQQVNVPFYPADQYTSQAPQQIEQIVNQVATRGGLVNRFHTLYPEELNENESVLVPLELISVDPTGDFQ